MPGTDEPADDPSETDPSDADSEATDEVPEKVIDEAERLTRLARGAVDENEARAYREERDRLIEEYGFRVRVREGDRDTLVCYPAEWVVEGTVHPDSVDDIDRGIERPLEGPGEAEQWETIAEHNRDIAATIEAEHGEIHGENARALAAFASNHYAKPIEDLTPEEREEFREEFFVRNAFPSDEQKALVDESIQVVTELLEK